MRLSPQSQTRRNRLLWRIHQSYRTMTDVLEFGPLRLGFERVADPDLVLDRLVEEEDRRRREPHRKAQGPDLHMPYWAELWDSALGLARLLVREHWPSGLRGVSVLDLGCGMGLAGTVAAALGADVLFGDLDPDALLFARLNALAFEQRVRTRQLNWQSARLPERFDLILGADILYERSQWDFLEPFWRGHLRPTGRILLGEPGRQTGEGFVGWIAPWGWTLTEHRQPVPTRAQPIRVLELRATHA